MKTMEINVTRLAKRNSLECTLPSELAVGSDFNEEISFILSQPALMSNVCFRLQLKLFSFQKFKQRSFFGENLKSEHVHR
jgi:hypothetical protein